MKNILFLMALITSNVFSADLVHCNGNCQKSCSDNEKVALALMDTASLELLKKFELKEDPAESHKQFIDNINDRLANLSSSKKSISDECLDKYCEQVGKKEMKTSLSSGLSLSYTNPVCDYSSMDRNPPMNFLMVLLENNKGSLAQMNFNKNGSSFSLIIKAPTQKCSDNEGGTFDNSIIVSLNSLAVVPNEGSTQVKNTPVGAQLIRKKKFVPRISLNGESVLLNLGDGYETTIDSSSNTITSTNLLRTPCKGSIIRNPSKGTSRLGINMNALNAKGSKVYDSNNYRAIDAASANVPW